MVIGLMPWWQRLLSRSAIEITVPRDAIENCTKACWRPVSPVYDFMALLRPRTCSIWARA